MALKEYRMRPEIAGLTLTRAIRGEIPQEYWDKVLEIADTAYLLGRADATMNIPENKGAYDPAALVAIMLAPKHDG